MHVRHALLLQGVNTTEGTSINAKHMGDDEIELRSPAFGSGQGGPAGSVSTGIQSTFTYRQGYSGFVNTTTVVATGDFLALACMHEHFKPRPMSLRNPTQNK